jgi:predicted DNA binding protein
MSHTLDTDKLKEVFEGLTDKFDKLTKWEQDFVESVKEQYENKGELTERQLEFLEKIWMKV